MNLITTDYLTIIIFALALLGVGFYLRKTKSYSDFAVGNRSFGFGLLLTSLVATIIGPGFSIGVVGQGFSTGLYFLLGAIAYGIGYILFGLFFSEKLSTYEGVYSLGGIMEKAYGKSGRLLTGIASFILLSGFVAIFAKVAGGILFGVTGLSVVLATISAVVLVAIYTFFGGMRTSVVTDAIQTIVFGSVLLFLFGLVVNNSTTSVSAIVSQGIATGVTELSTMPILAVIGFVISLMFGEVLLPPMIGRALSAKNAAVSRKTFLATGLLIPVILGMFLVMGLYAATGMVSADIAGDDVIFSLANQLLSPGLYGLFIIALLSIVMSSLDSILQSGAVVVTSDIFATAKDSAKVLVARSSIVVLAIIGGLLALVLPDLISTLLIIYSLWVPIILVPLVYAVLRPNRTTKNSGTIAMIIAGLSAYVWEFVLGSPAGFPGILFGIVISLLIMELSIHLGSKDYLITNPDRLAK